MKGRHGSADVGTDATWRAAEGLSYELLNHVAVRPLKRACTTCFSSGVSDLAKP